MAGRAQGLSCSAPAPRAVPGGQSSPGHGPGGGLCPGGGGCVPGGVWVPGFVSPAEAGACFARSDADRGAAVPREAEDAEEAEGEEAEPAAAAARDAAAAGAAAAGREPPSEQSGHGVPGPGQRLRHPPGPGESRDKGGTLGSSGTAGSSGSRGQQGDTEEFPRERHLFPRLVLAGNINSSSRVICLCLVPFHEGKTPPCHSSLVARSHFFLFYFPRFSPRLSCSTLMFYPTVMQGCSRLHVWL